MKSYIAMLYLLAMVTVVSAYKVVTMSCLPFIATFIISACLLIVAYWIIYSAEDVREIRSKIDKG